MARRYTVLIEWTDRHDDSHFDADEVQVVADSAASAIAAAREKWARTKGAEWPRCVQGSATILTFAARCQLALPQ